MSKLLIIFATIKAQTHLTYLLYGWVDNTACASVGWFGTHASCRRGMSVVYLCTMSMLCMEGTLCPASLNKQGVSYRLLMKYHLGMTNSWFFAIVASALVRPFQSTHSTINMGSKEVSFWYFISKTFHSDHNSQNFHHHNFNL